MIPSVLEYQLTRTEMLVWLFLGCATLVRAQCDGPSITIRSSSDLESISSCQIYNGDITIDSTYADAELSLSGVEVIHGDLNARNISTLKSLRADNLTTIDGTLSLQQLMVLSTLDLPSIDTIHRIEWIALPSLQSLTPASRISQSDVTYISNTALSDLDSLIYNRTDQIDVNNNQYLRSVELRLLQDVSNSVSFTANGLNLNLEFATLLSAGNLTFRNISGLALPSLKTVTGSFGCYACYTSAIVAPTVENIGGSLSLHDSNAYSIDFPRLRQVGGSFDLKNNTNVNSVNGFPVLSEVDGNFTLQGNFVSVDFPSLPIGGGRILGDVSVGTTSDNSSFCGFFTNLGNTGVVSGTVQCSSNLNSSNGTSPSVSAASGGATATGRIVSDVLDSPVLSGAAIAGIVVGGLAVIAFIGAGFWFLRRRRRQARVMAKDNNDGTEPLPGYAQLPLGKHHEKAELDVDPKSVTELNGGIHGQARAIPGLHEADTVHILELSGEGRKESDSATSSEIAPSPSVEEKK